jgi:hypothetical protein
MSIGNMSEKKCIYLIIACYYSEKPRDSLDDENCFGSRQEIFEFHCNNFKEN